jgi:hypothetical protein
VVVSPRSPSLAVPLAYYGRTRLRSPLPYDLPAFCGKVVEEIAEDKHRQHVGAGAGGA